MKPIDIVVGQAVTIPVDDLNTGELLFKQTFVAGFVEYVKPDMTFSIGLDIGFATLSTIPDNIELVTPGKLRALRDMVLDQADKIDKILRGFQ